MAATMEIAMPDNFTSFFLHTLTGDLFSADDPIGWCLENAQTPLLAAGRERLLLCNRRTDGDRILNVALRRCGLNLIDIRPGRVTVRYWTGLVDLHPILKSRGLLRSDVRVALVRQKTGLVILQPGDDFLSGERPGSDFFWAEYRERWERRHERQPDDEAASPRGRSSYSWERTVEGRIPWVALKSAWRNEPATLCPNCDLPLAVWSFSWRHRTLLSMSGHVARCCFGCRHDFREDTGDPWPWVVATLDGGLLPASQDDGIKKTDLRPRWPAPPPRNLRDLNNLPPDLTLDELVSILM